jgi:hypothetical protein
MAKTTTFIDARLVGNTDAQGSCRTKIMANPLKHQTLEITCYDNDGWARAVLHSQSLDEARRLAKREIASGMYFFVQITQGNTVLATYTRRPKASSTS